MPEANNSQMSDKEFKGALSSLVAGPAWIVDKLVKLVRAEDREDFFPKVERESELDRHVFINLHPHPEEPISDETFMRLDSVIESIEQTAGVSNDSWHFAASESYRGVPDVSVGRSTNSDGLRCVYFSIHDGDNHISFEGRNDAGTIRNRDQNAITRTVYGRANAILEHSTTLPDREMAQLVDALEERAREYPFVAKRMKIRL